MEQAFEFFFGAYFGVSPWLVGLEMTAVFLGVLSVWFATRSAFWFFQQDSSAQVFLCIFCGFMDCLGT